MFSKRGQELSIGTLVLIVLGVIVLVLLVLGFSMGWDNLFGKLNIFQGSDLESVVAACRIATSTDSKVSYCEFKTAKIDGKKININCEYGKVEDALGEDRLNQECGTPYDSSGRGIQPICGNGKIDSGEECDGTVPEEKNCLANNKDTPIGKVKCTKCKFDYSDCRAN